MKKIAALSLLLVLGMAIAQILPSCVGAHYHVVSHVIELMTMTALAFIMIQVGMEFEVDKSRLRQYGTDYLVAMATAACPWILVTLYFVFCMLPSTVWGSWEAWKETLLAGRFAAPTSAGILLAMLAAAGLKPTWMYGKARTLAIFDDLDTILLMIPLKLLMIGFVWQLGANVFLIVVLLAVAWILLHKCEIPSSWRAVLLYSIAIAGVSELVYEGTKLLDRANPLHIEVLLPAFVLGCAIKPRLTEVAGRREKPRVRSDESTAQLVSTVVSAAFLLLVGLSMPALSGNGHVLSGHGTITAQQEFPSWVSVLFHVLAITLLANVGKLFPLMCYREVPFRQRLALAVSLWPRGEVGAGVLMVSLSYGIGGPIIGVAMLCLATNLVMTGGFIFLVKGLLAAPADAPLIPAWLRHPVDLVVEAVLASSKTMTRFLVWASFRLGTVRLARLAWLAVSCLIGTVLVASNSGGFGDDPAVILDPRFVDDNLRGHRVLNKNEVGTSTVHAEWKRWHESLVAQANESNVRRDQTTLQGIDNEFGCDGHVCPFRHYALCEIFAGSNFSVAAALDATADGISDDN